MKLDFEGEYPRCFNSRVEFKAWVQAARGSSPRAGFCTDCSKEYQAQMEKERRCQYPEVEFYDSEMDRDGYFPNRNFYAKGFYGEDWQEQEQVNPNPSKYGYGAEAESWAAED